MLRQPCHDDLAWLSRHYIVAAKLCITSCASFITVRVELGGGVILVPKMELGVGVICVPIIELGATVICVPIIELGVGVICVPIIELGARVIFVPKIELGVKSVPDFYIVLKAEARLGLSIAVHDAIRARLGLSTAVHDAISHPGNTSVPGM